MPKNIVQDVVPPSSRKSIRDIPLPHQNHESPGEVSLHYSRTEKETVSWDNNGGGNFSKWLIWVIGIVSVGVLVFVLSNIFSGATLTITPKSQTVAVNLTLTAKPNAPAGGLSYRPFPLTLEKGITVPADGQKSIQTEASGTIIIYNNYSTAPQLLVKNTRFETPNGLIYKIATAVTIPGMHSVAGQVIPGSISVSVYAESAGEQYNIGLTDFTIPGFKSNAQRYADFYGRSKTAMTGGKIGTVKTVSDQKTLQARTKLDSDLLAGLLTQARAHVPADSIFYTSAYRISFEPVATSSESGTGVVIQERALFSAYFIKRGDLAEAVALNSLANFSAVPVLMPDAAKLAFTLDNKGNESATSVGPIQFGLKGNATIVWQIDENKLVAELAGKNKSELSGIAANDPAVLKAVAVIRPFWSSVFPESSGKIKINIESAK